LLAGLGALLLLAGATAFVAEIWHISKQKKHQKEVRAFLKSRGLSEAFVPKVKSHTAVQLGAAGGVVAGLSLFILGMIRISSSRREGDYTVGSDPESCFHVSEGFLPRGVYRFPLVRPDGDGFELLYTENMEGEVALSDGKTLTLKQLSAASVASPADLPQTYALRLTGGMHSAIRMGQNTFEVSCVLPPRGVSGGGKRGWKSYAYYGVSLVGHAVLMFLVFGVPRDGASMQADSISPPRMKNLATRELRNQQKEMQSSKEKVKPDKPKPGKNKKADGQGEPDPRLDKKNSGRSKAPGPDHGRTTAARTAGIVGVLNRLSSGKMLASVFGRDSAISSDAENVLHAGLIGHDVGDAFDGFGPTGRGAPTSGAGTIGLGPQGPGSWGDGSVFTQGGVPGGRRFRGYRPPRHKAGGPRMFDGKVTVEGDGVSRAAIRRIIKRHRAEIRYCYVSKGLSVNRNLSGKVVVKFIINKMGRVTYSAIVRSTLQHRPTENCIRQAVRRWLFPRTNSIVVATYPFHFKPATR
jgi:TonB family protein